MNSKIAFFVSSLCEWYQKHKRDLPFRKTRDPYKIWISEVMLQQTRMGAVLNVWENKYQIFLQEFPDIYHLAKSPLEKVLSIWSGLGYYHRAKNLHKTANIIVSQYDGKIPEDFHILKTLPGIGDYIASAILSIAYNQPYAVLDGNAIRVLSRFFYQHTQKLSRKQLQDFANTIIKKEHPSPSIYNQAIMELGSLVCIKYPRCKECPIAGQCDVVHFSLERKKQIPFRKTSVKKDLNLNIYLYIRDDQILIQKNDKLILKNQFFFPFEDISSSHSSILQESEKKYIGTVQHTIMNYRIQANIFFIEVFKSTLSNSIINKTETRWISLSETRQYLFSSFAQKILNRFEQYKKENWLF